MAYDDTSRWHDRQYDRRIQFQDQYEATGRLYGALARGDHDTARFVLGMPPAETSPTPEPAPRRAPTAGEQFREHLGWLLHQVRYTWALPEALQESWIARIEPLDIENAEAGLCVIEEIRDEYERLSENPPPNSNISRRIEWDHRMPRIANEISWVTELFRHVLKCERERHPLWGDYPPAL